MQKIKTVAGLVWIAVVFSLGTYLFMNMFDDDFQLKWSRFLSVPDFYSGTKDLMVEDTGDYVLVIQDVVWSGLLEKGGRGFLEVKWTFTGEKTPVNCILSLPDGTPLGTINVDPAADEAEFQPMHSSVMGLMDVSTIGGRWYLLSRTGKRTLLNQDNWYAVRIIVDRSLWEADL